MTFMTGNDELGPNDLGRILGRIEQKQDEAKESATGRDERLQELNDRVKENAHTANNSSMTLNGTMKTLQDTTSRNADALDGINARVEALEAPIKIALEQRERRRNLIARVVTLTASGAATLWLFAEPIYKVLAGIVAKQWMDR